MIKLSQRQGREKRKKEQIRQRRMHSEKNFSFKAFKELFRNDFGVPDIFFGGCAFFKREQHCPRRRYGYRGNFKLRSAIDFRLRNQH